MSIPSSYQVTQATEVWVVTGLVIVQGQSVMVRVVACRLVSHMSINFSNLGDCADRAGWNFGMSSEPCQKSLYDACAQFPGHVDPHSRPESGHAPFRRRRTSETV